MSDNTSTPPAMPTATPTVTASTNPAAAKFWPAFLLCMFLGIFAAHRFYLKAPKRVLMLLTLGGFGLWAFVDCLVLLLGKFKDGTGATIPNPKPAVSWSVFAVLVVIGMAGQNGGGGGISGDYEPISSDVGMGYETVKISGGFLAYVGIIDRTNKVTHGGTFRVTKSTKDETEFACTDAVITLTIGGDSREMKGTFIGVVTFKDGETLLKYAYQNLESANGMEIKEFRKKK